MADKDDTFFKEMCQYHISGQLKVAPEHIADAVLQKLGKPENSVYKAFCKKYAEINKKLGKPQYLVPYLMSSHPGSTLKEAIALAEYLRDLGYMPEQFQRVCIIQALTREQWKKCMLQMTRMKRLCKGH